MFEELFGGMNLKDIKMDSIGSHYGIKEDDFDNMVGEMLKDIYLSKKKSEVVDKHFPKCSAEDRVKIIAYNVAMSTLKVK